MCSGSLVDVEPAGPEAPCRTYPDAFDLTVTTGYLCDTSPKSNEMMEQVFGIPAYCVDHVQDRQMDEYPDASRATALSAKGMRRFGDVVRDEAG